MSLAANGNLRTSTIGILVMIIKWFDASKAKAFGAEMADIFHERARSKPQSSRREPSAKKSEIKHEATFLLIERRLATFKRENRLNIYTKAQLGSAFKYALIDKGYDQELAEKTTTWLLLKCK